VSASCPFEPITALSCLWLQKHPLSCGCIKSQFRREVNNE
jgi:hypothetical protein